MLFLLDALNRFLNRLFAGPIDALLPHLGVHPAQAKAPITNALTLELVVFFLLVLFFVLVRMTLSVEKPGVIQITAESIYEFVGGIDRVVRTWLQSDWAVAWHFHPDF